MNNIETSFKNITNSGLEQINYKKGSVIYKINEKPKFAYYVYTGSVDIIKDFDASLKGRHVVIVEDIIDTGTTLKFLSCSIIHFFFWFHSR